MYSEANRRETFTSWPHAGYRWAQPDPMAQAGFYHQVGSERTKRSTLICTNILSLHLCLLSAHSQYLHSVKGLFVCTVEHVSVSDYCKIIQLEEETSNRM